MKFVETKKVNIFIFSYCLIHHIAFYYKQLSFVENKYSKISRELNIRRESEDNIRKRRDTITMLCSGSKRILDRKRASSKSQMSRSNNQSILKYKSDDGKSDIPDTMHTNLHIHEKLYHESAQRKIKRKLLHYNKYRNTKNSLYTVSNSQLQKSQSGTQIFRSSMSISDLKTPNSKFTKYSNTHTARGGVNHRLQDMKSGEKRLNQEMMGRTSPILTSNRLYQDALIRQKSKEMKNRNRNKLSRSPINTLKNK
jgi:hypothetical protein